MLIEALQKRFAQQEKSGLIRKRNLVKKSIENKILIQGNICVDFSSNDYLGLAKHPKITEAFIQAAKKYGVGSGASAHISGYSEEHEKTEHLFSEWLRVDKAILFNSGYCANTGIMNALANRSSIIFSDKLCHASLLDGITLSRAKHQRYRHINIAHLNQLAESHPPHFIITEGVFSMEGSIAPLPSLIQCTEKYSSGLIIDDAHGIGVLGKNGRGIIEHYDVDQDQFSCVTLPLGKAFNALGAIVAGRSEVIDALLQFSNTYRYTTALPPAICSAIHTALHLMQIESWRRDRLKENIRWFIAYATEKKLRLTTQDETPIQSVLIYDNQKVIHLQHFLLSQGFYVSAIRPPTVPKNQARLRISLNSLHTQDQITALIDHITKGLSTC